MDDVRKKPKLNGGKTNRVRKVALDFGDEALMPGGGRNKLPKSEPLSGTLTLR